MGFMAKYLSFFIVSYFFLSLIVGNAYAGDNYEPNSLVIQCQNNSNIILVLDSSGSTTGEDPTTGNTFIGLILANALSIVQKIESDSRVGVVTFGGVTVKTDLLSMESSSNKAELEKFIRGIEPPGGDNPTDLGKGLQVAEELLNSVSGRKQIIVISDGMMPPEGVEPIKKTVFELKNKGIDIQFIQVILEYQSVKKPLRLYNEIAEASDGQVMILNPNERMTVPKYILESDNPCKAFINETMTIIVTANNGIPIESAEVSFNNTNIGNTDIKGELAFSIQISSGFYNISATKLGYEKGEKSIHVLPIPTIIPTIIPMLTTTQVTTPIPTPLEQEVRELKERVKSLEEKQSQNESRKSWIESIIDWLKSIF